VTASVGRAAAMCQVSCYDELGVVPSRRQPTPLLDGHPFHHQVAAVRSLRVVVTYRFE